MNDVVLSKLLRYSPDDANDIRAMADKELINHAGLVTRFKLAAERYALDARATEVPGYLKNLHTVERDILALPLSDIELPPECLPD